MTTLAPRADHISEEAAHVISCPTCHAKKNVTCRGTSTHPARYALAREWYIEDGRDWRKFKPKKSVLVTIAQRDALREADLDLREAARLDALSPAERRAERLATRPVYHYVTQQLADPETKTCLACGQPIPHGDRHILTYNEATRARCTYHDDPGCKPT